MSAARFLVTAGALAGVAVLAGCTTVGSHIHGSFACQAPEGVCAPSATIDDRALAIISGETSPVARPAGPYAPAPDRSHAVRTVSATQGGTPAVDAQRTGEKVLRVVFQPYVDGYGRLHEASTVRAVVRGEWQAAAAVPPAVRALDPTAAGASLADAVDRADLPVATAGIDPDQPSAAAVAAARAKIDPVAAIRADVASRLAARDRGHQGRSVGAARATSVVRTATTTPFRAGIPGTLPPIGARQPGTTAATAAAEQIRAPSSRPPLPVSPAGGAPATAVPAAVAARVRGDPRVVTAAAATQAGARASAAAPAPAPAGQPVIHAASFPGTSEDN